MRHNVGYYLSAFLSKSYIHAWGEFRAFPQYFARNGSAAEVVVYAPRWRNKHITSDAVWFREYLLALKNKGIKVGIVSDVSEVRSGQKVIWRPSEKWLPEQWRYSSKVSAGLIQMAQSIENRGAILTPDSQVISCYENKVNMHNMFERVGVRSPKTFIVDNEEKYESAVAQIGLPFIAKGAFSYSSSHLLLIGDKKQADDFRASLFYSEKNNSLESENQFAFPILVQEYLDIRKDVRVVFVGKEIYLSYWRINPSAAWKSTATRFGSKTAYESFPAKWRAWLLDMIERIQFPWGGFDIAWNYDDVDGEPYVLEVSPFFEPNPAPPEKYKDNYFNFKYHARFEYNMGVWRTIQRIANAQVDWLLSQ